VAWEWHWEQQQLEVAARKVLEVSAAGWATAVASGQWRKARVMCCSEQRG